MRRWLTGKLESPDASAIREPATDLRCSFCNKTQADVRKLIAGPTVFICDECVDVCVDIMANDERERLDKESPGEPAPPRAARRPGKDAVPCGLCGQTTALDMLPIEGRGMLCGGCADAVEDALAHGRPLS